MYFCVPDAEGAVPTDAPVQRTSRRRAVPLAAPTGLQTILDHVSNIKSGNRKGKEFLSSFPKEIPGFRFVKANLTDHVLEEKGIACPKTDKLVIYYSTLFNLLGLRDVRLNYTQRDVILCNMFKNNDYVLLYVFGKEEESTYMLNTFKAYKQYHKCTFTLGDTGVIMDIFELAIAPTTVSKDVLVLLPESTECQITQDDQSNPYVIECIGQEDEIKNIKMDYQKLLEQCGIAAFTNYLSGPTFSVVCPRSVQSPLLVPFFEAQVATKSRPVMIPSYVACEGLNKRFIAAFTEEIKITVFGNALPYYNRNGTWDEELAVISWLVNLIDPYDYGGVLLMVSTAYKHSTTEPPLRELAKRINTTALLENDSPVTFHARLLEYSPVDSDEALYSIRVEKGNIANIIYFTKPSTPTPVHTISNALVHASWDMKSDQRPEAPFSVFVKTVAREGVAQDSRIITVHSSQFSSTQASITYSINSPESGTFNIVFGVQIGKNRLNVDLHHIAVTATTTADSSSGSSLLFRSGRQLDMMITV
jgi:hypothetical protein